MTFWDTLFERNKVVLGLSPMDGVTDVVMRQMIAKYSSAGSEQGSGEGVNVLFTEFVSVDALFHITEPRKVEQVMRAFLRVRSLKCNSDTVTQCHNIYEVAQVFGHKPELFYQAAVLVAILGFDGLDINMGCPASKVEELGSGAGLIRTPKVAQEIVRQAKQGVADFAAGKVTMKDLDYSPAVKVWVERHKPNNQSPITNNQTEAIPVSVKTRIGVEKETVAEWIPAIMETKPAVLSLHGRTLKQLYQGRADWEAIARAAEIVHKMGGKILGNGDVKTVEEALEKAKQYGVDGILIGRAAEGNPGIFTGSDPTKAQRIAWIWEHVELYHKLFVQCHSDTVSQTRAFLPVRKHLAWYASGFPGASELRQQLVQCNDIGEVKEAIRESETRLD